MAKRHTLDDPIYVAERVKQVKKKAVLSKAALYSKARKKAIKKLIAAHQQEWNELWTKEALAAGFKPHALSRKKKVYTLEQRIKKLKKELDELSVS